MKTLQLNRKNKAFTLVELMVVIVIIAILASLIVPRLINRTAEAEGAKAEADLATLSKTLDTFRLDVGYYPSTEEGLASLREFDAEGWQGPYLQQPLDTDPWGNEYVYEWPGQDGDDSYFLFSLGPDGTESEDDILGAGF